MIITIIFICLFGILFCAFMIVWTNMKKSKAKNNSLQKLNLKEEFTPKSFIDMHGSLKKN